MARQRPDPSRRPGRRLGAAAGALLALFALGVRAATASDAGTPQILIRNFRFEPTTVEVPVGSSVSWVNQDEEIHTVTATQTQKKGGPDDDRRCIDRETASFVILNAVQWNATEATMRGSPEGMNAVIEATADLVCRYLFRDTGKALARDVEESSL